MHVLRIALLVVLFAALVPSAEAQQPAPSELTIPEDTAAAQLEGKDPTRAVLYSVSGTVLLAPLFGTGLIVGPAFGHFYAENEKQAWAGIGTRVGAAVTPIVLTAIAAGRNDEPYAGLGTFLVSGALALIVIGGSAVYDIVTADNSVRQYNRRVLGARVTPTVGGPGGEQVGLSVTVPL